MSALHEFLMKTVTMMWALNNLGCNIYVITVQFPIQCENGASLAVSFLRLTTTMSSSVTKEDYARVEDGLNKIAESRSRLQAVLANETIE